MMFLVTLATMILAALPSFAQLNTIERATLLQQNLIENPGFENGLTRWTNSGGTVTLGTTGDNLLEGRRSAVFTASAASQTFQSALVTVPEILRGRTCSASARYNLLSPNMVMEVLDGSSNVLASASLVNVSTASTRVVSTVFPCPAPASQMRVRFRSIGIGGATIDRVHLGELSSETIESPISDWTTFTPTGTWTANTTYSGRWRRVGTDAEIQFTVSLSGAPTATILYVNLPSGLVIDTSRLILSQSGTNLGVATFADVGPNTGYNGTVFYETTTSVGFSADEFTTHTGTVRPYQNRVSNTLPFTFGASDFVNGTFRVPIVGWNVPQGGLRFDQIGWRVDANISGANISLGTTAVTAYQAPDNASLTLTNNTGFGTLPAQIGCAGTNPPTGTTCAVGNEQPAISFTVPAAGDVLVCAQFSHFVQTAASATGVTAAFQLVETATNSQTIIQEGKSRISSTYENTVVQGGNMPYRLCGTFNFATAGQKMIRLMYEQATAGTVNANQIVADASATIGQRDIHFEAYPINQSWPMPLIVNSVTTSGTTERTERARITNSGSCAVAAQSGSWISSISRPSTGQCLMNFAAGLFSDVPTCHATMSSVGAFRSCQIDAVSASSVTITCASIGSTPTATDVNFHLSCHGPR